MRLLLRSLARNESTTVTNKTLKNDIQFSPKDDVPGTLPGILIEVKSLKIHSPGDLKELAESTLRQMERRGYDAELRSRGIDTIVKYGAAFRGKEVEVVMEKSKHKMQENMKWKKNI